MDLRENFPFPFSFSFPLTLFFCMKKDFHLLPMQRTLSFLCYCVGRCIFFLEALHAIGVYLATTAAHYQQVGCLEHTPPETCPCLALVGKLV